MISEIITYCYVLGDENVNKAIMFTKDSEQYFQWTGKKDGKPYKYAAREQIKQIIRDNDIAVFCIENSGEKYKIEKFE